MSERFEVNGIEVTAYPLGNGMYIGVPKNLMKALAAVLSGDLLTLPRVIRRLEEPTPAGTMTRSYPPTPSPGSWATSETGLTGSWGHPYKADRQRVSETITQYRARTGMSRTQTADLLNISRRTLGRWEQKGKRMNEV